MSYKKKIKESYNRIHNRISGQDRVVMFHIGRCGSTVLGNMLKQHSRITWASEVFEQRHCDNQAFGSEKEIFHYLETANSRGRGSVFGIEIKMLPGQHPGVKCLNLELPALVALLRKKGFNKFIILERENLLRRVASVALVLNEGNWYAKEERTKAARTSITAPALADTGEEDLLNSFRVIKGHYKELERLLDGEDVLKISYENDIQGGPGRAYGKVISFLQLSPEDAEVRFKKQNPYPLDQILIDFSQIKSKLQSTEFAWMISDRI